MDDKFWEVEVSRERVDPQKILVGTRDNEVYIILEYFVEKISNNDRSRLSFKTTERDVIKLQCSDITVIIPTNSISYIFIENYSSV